MFTVQKDSDDGCVMHGVIGNDQKFVCYHSDVVYSKSGFTKTDTYSVSLGKESFDISITYDLSKRTARGHKIIGTMAEKLESVSCGDLNELVESLCSA